MKTSKRTTSENRQADQDALLHSISEVSIYDCLDIAGPTDYALAGTRSQRLFGNANVGNLDLTNLQVAGQFPSGQVFLIGGWHVRIDVPYGSIRDAWDRVAPHVHATLVVGSMPRLHGTFDTMNMLPAASRRIWPIYVPQRQHFSVQVDLFGDGIEIGRLQNVLGRENARVRAWVHLDGILLRPPETGGAVHDSLIERVHRHMIHVETETRSVEQRIVDWITSQSQSGDDASQAQLAAICDGILESRWNR